jgi:hypothetical protein
VRLPRKGGAAHRPDRDAAPFARPPERHEELGRVFVGLRRDRLNFA